MSRSVLLPAIACAAGLGFLNGALAGGADWPQTNHDGARTGFNPSEKQVAPDNISTLQMKWGQAVPGSVVSLAVNGGKLFAQSQGSGAGRVLTALDATSGAVRWSVTTGSDGLGDLNVSMAADKKGVYAGCAQSDGISGTDGAVCAYNPSTGKLRWFYCDCASGGDAAINAPLTYDDGVIYFGYRAHISGQETPEQYLIAVDAASGIQRWRTDFGDTGGAGSLGTSPVTAADGHVYVSCAQGRDQHRIAALCALSETDGKVIWRKPLNSLASGLEFIGMTVVGNVLYANISGAINEIAAVDVTTAKLLWKRPGVCCASTPPAIAGKLLYVSAPDPQNNSAQTLFALKAKNGKLKWAADPNSACASASVANGVVYEQNCANDNVPTTSAFDAKTGALLWNNPIGAATGPYPPPVIANGTVYIVNTTHQTFNVAAFRPAE